MDSVIHTIAVFMKQLENDDWHWPTCIATFIALITMYYTHRIMGWIVTSRSQSNKVNPLSDECVNALLDYFLLIGKLKRTPRTGWVVMGVPQPESVSDHMYRLAVMVAALSPLQRDSPSFGLALLQALVHDQAEAIVGDITPEEFSGVTKAKKAAMEAAAMNEITSRLGVRSIDLAKINQTVFQDYESNGSASAVLLHELDKLEMMVQALEYETEKVQSQKQKKSSSLDHSKQEDLARFYDSRSKVKDPAVKSIAAAIWQRRQKLFENEQ